MSHDYALPESHDTQRQASAIGIAPNLGFVAADATFGVRADFDSARPSDYFSSFGPIVAISALGATRA